MTRRESEKALEHLAALERLDRIVAAFASMVRHETRTALVGIQGLSELIRDGDLEPEEIRGYASDIFIEAEKINSLIGDVFDLSRLETGQFIFTRTLVDVNHVAREVIEELADKGAHHSIDFDPEVGPAMVVSGDRDRLRQALNNVVRFCAGTAKSGTLISVGVRAVAGECRLNVHSSSLRLADFDDWLFGRYERYEHRPSLIIGAGLGLAIARVIVEIHGGRIEAHTSARGGSEFELSLPTV